MSQEHGKLHGEAFGLQVEQKHHRKKKKRRRENGYDDERQDGNELRKKKKENKQARDDVAETLNKSKNNFKSGKGDYETDESEATLKTLNKAKKRHLVDDLEQGGSDAEKQHKRLRLDPLVVSKNGDNKEKRKPKASFSNHVQVDLQTTTKHKLQQNKNSRDKFHQMDEKAESDNVYDYLEPSVLDISSSGCSFIDNVVGSGSEKERESRKKKKKKKDKEKEKNKTATILTEDVDTNHNTETLPTHIYMDMVKSSPRNQDKESISCNQVAKNKHGCREQGMLKSGDERSLLDTSNDVEQRNKMNGKRMKKKKKGKEEESNQREQDESVMDVTGVNNRNEAINSRAEMVENVEDPNVKEKQKRKKKKRKEEKGNHREQDESVMDITGVNNRNEAINTRAEMVENVEEPNVKEKQKKKKKKRREEESNHREQDVSIMDMTGVNNRNEAINTRAEMVENVEDPKVKEKQKKEKKKKRKVEERRKMGQDLAISNILDEKEVSNSTAVMAESIEKQKDNEKLREAMAHAEIIHETWTVPTERLKVLKEKGIKVKTGKWSLQELRLLQSNMDKFLETYELPDPVRILLRSGTDREDRKFWKRFGRQNEFYKELGRGILRPLNTIYKCATRIYDESNYVGKYSEEEVRELKRLHTVHGADWVTIGQLLGRSRMSVNRKYSKLPTTEGGRGTWTEDEVKCLKEAVYQVTKTAEDQPVPFHGIYWPDVAKIVKTRNIEQCRRKWLENLSWMNDEEEKKWTKQNELRLITRLYNSGITQECDVDWMEVKSDFKSNYPPQWLRKKWLEVKRKAPNYHQMEFEDILDYLYHVYGKTLRAQLEAEASTSSNDAS